MSIQQYLDITCESFEQFQEEVFRLQQQGYVALRPISANKMRYRQIISRQQPGPELKDAREFHGFENIVEEAYWEYRRSGYDVKRLPAYRENGARWNNHVQFMVRKINVSLPYIL